MLTILFQQIDIKTVKIYIHHQNLCLYFMKIKGLFLFYSLSNIKDKGINKN